MKNKLKQVLMLYTGPENYNNPLTTLETTRSKFIKEKARWTCYTENFLQQDYFVPLNFSVKSP